MDCSKVLSNDPHHIKGLFIKFCKYIYIYTCISDIALFRRASCLLAKQQYEEAKRDLDILLTIDEDNNEAKVRFSFL